MISIIIPTLNEESVLEGTLKTLVVGLNKGEYEIIISDGKSKDRTRAIAERYGATVLEYTGTTRQTIGEAKNDGARVARGEYLIFIDADVTVPEANKFFARALAHFAKQPKLVAATVRLAVHKNMATLTDRVIFWLVGLTFLWQNNILGTGGSSGEFQMVRAEAFRKIGGFNPKLAVAEDNDLFWRLAKIGKSRIFYDLVVYHTGRRAHKIGWPKLLWQWWSNWFSVVFLKKSSNSEWTPIR